MVFAVYDTPDPPPEHFQPVRLKLSDRLKHEPSVPPCQSLVVTV